jgi:hypothetical protein
LLSYPSSFQEEARWSFSSFFSLNNHSIKKEKKLHLNLPLEKRKKQETRNKEQEKKTI